MAVALGALVHIQTKNFREYLTAFQKDMKSYQLGNLESQYEEAVDNAMNTVKKRQIWNYGIEKETRKPEKNG